MRRLALVVAAILSLASTGAAGQAMQPAEGPDEFRFRGIVLGQTLAQFRQLRHPDRPANPHIRPACAHDATVPVDGPLPTVAMSGERIGQTQCRFAAFRPVAGPDRFPADFEFGGSTGSVEFSFIPDDQGVQRLMGIFWESPTSRYADVLEALQKAYGPPTRDIDEPYLDNGRRVPSRHKRWDRANTRIDVIERFLRRDRMTVYVQHLPLVRHHDDLMRRWLRSPRL